jgi:hypothetical protein
MDENQLMIYSFISLDKTDLMLGRVHGGELVIKWQRGEKR